MKKLIAMFVAVAAICLAGCGAKTPEAVAEKFYGALCDSNADKAAEYCTDAAKGAIQMAKGMGMFEQDEFKKKVKGAKVKAKEAKINGDKAKVTVEITKDGSTETEDLDLVKVDGAWKVDIKK